MCFRRMKKKASVQELEFRWFFFYPIQMIYMLIYTHFLSFEFKKKALVIKGFQKLYQLAFTIPGIFPALASSLKVTREIPNFRI